MAFIGNDMFGHGMTHHPSSLMHNGGGHFGSGGFGSGSNKSSFGSGMSGGGGFGQGFGSSGGSHAGANPNQPMFHRQNSLLTDMTHSKTDPKPSYVSEFNQSAVRHEDQMYSNMYAKPLEKPKPKPVTVKEKRKTFQRQAAVSDDDITRPPRLSARTRSQSVSMYPDQLDGPRQPMNMDLAQPLLRRSNTMSDKPHKSKHKFLRPLSIGQRFRKRTDSRSSTSSTEPRSEPPRSLKYDSDIEINVQAGRARASSDAPQRTHPDKSDDEQARLILSLMNPPSSPEPEMDNKRAFGNPNQAVPANHPDAHKHEIPSSEILDSPSTVRRRFQDKPLDQDNISLRSGQSTTSGRSTPKSVHVITTPGLIRTLTIETPAKKQQNSPRRIPTQSPSRSPNQSARRSPYRSPRRSPNPSPVSKPLHTYKPEVVNTKNPNYRSDSDNSDTYYECEMAEDNRKPTRKDNMDKKRGKARPEAEKPRPSLLSTGYNSDDEASNPNSPKTDFKGEDPFHNYVNVDYGSPKDETPESQHDDSTLCVRTLIDTFNRKAKDNAEEEAPPSPSLNHVKPEVRDIVAAMAFAKHIDNDNEADNNPHSRYLNNPLSDVYHDRPPAIVIPQFESLVKGQEPNTAESSESGYTSNLQNSPREFDLKAAQYVNSLPNHSELGSKQSATSKDLIRDGSHTDSDNESEVSETPCKSGSDTDYHMSDPETCDESVTKLEVMKILESPSDVVQRIQTQMPLKEKTKLNEVPLETVPFKAKKASIQTAPVPINPKIIHSPNSAFVEKLSSLKKNQQKSDDSETELMHLPTSESKVTRLNLDGLPNNSRTPKSETFLVNTSKPGSPKASAETKLVSKKSSSIAATIMDLPLLGFRKRRLSSVEQTKCTNFLDSFLHCLNVLLFFSSGGVVGVGIWLILKEFNVNHVAEIFGNNIIQVIMYTAVGGAALALLAAMCLCCGVRRDKFGLGFYASVLVVTVLALGTATVLCTIYVEKLKGVEFKIQFKDRLVEKYGNSEIDPWENKFFTEAWDKMQLEFECCGAHGNVNDTTSWAVYKKFSAWYKIQPNKLYHFVPESCCVPDADVDVCMGSDHKLYGPPVYGPPLDKGFSAKNPNLNTNGCFKMVTAYLHQVLTITALVTGCLAGLYFAVVMLTWVFCFNRRTDTEYDYSSYDYYEDEVFDEEEEIEDEEAVETENSAINYVNNDHTSAVDAMADKRIHANPLKSENTFNEKMNMHEYPNDNFTDFNSATNHTTVEMMPQTPRNPGAIPYHSETALNHMTLIERISPHVIDRMSPNSTERFSPASEEEAIDRRDRYERSDSRLNQLFTETIEEEDSNFEDSDTDTPHDHRLTQSQLKGYFRIKNA